MTIDISRHKTILFQILKDIYTDSSISPYLGFKGGTAAYMFFGLERFSADLDFDLLEDSEEDFVFQKVIDIAQKFGSLKESHKKRFNLFCVVSYEDKFRNIKVEINRRIFASSYEIKTYLGVSMQVMQIEDMFAHKLMAMHERMGDTSRDIFDVWSFLQKRYPINKSMVEKRAEMSFNQLITTCIDQLQKLDNRRILYGLGELLLPNQKDWVKAKLRQETIALLTLRLEEGR